MYSTLYCTIYCTIILQLIYIIQLMHNNVDLLIEIKYCKLVLTFIPGYSTGQYATTYKILLPPIGIRLILHTLHYIT